MKRIFTFFALLAGMATAFSRPLEVDAQGSVQSPSGFFAANSGTTASTFAAGNDSRILAGSSVAARLLGTGTLTVSVSGSAVTTDGAQTLANKVIATGTLGTNLNGGGQRINNLSDPSAAGDAATMNYVDSGFLPINNGTAITLTIDEAYLKDESGIDGVTVTTAFRGLLDSTGSPSLDFGNRTAQDAGNNTVFDYNNRRLYSDWSFYGSFTGTGNITAGNFSGTSSGLNTGDQTLASLGFGTQTVTPSSGTATINLASGNSVSITVSTATTVLAMSNATPGVPYFLRVNTGTFNNPVVSFPAGSTQSLSGTNNYMASGTGIAVVDVVPFIYTSGTTIRILDPSVYYTP